MLTRSRKIGFMVLLAGSRRTRFFSLKNRFRVASPSSSRTATIWPSRACSWLVDDDEVAVGDVLLDHRVARDPEGELVVGPLPLGELQLLVLLDGLDRRPAAIRPSSFSPAGGRVVGSSRSWIARDMFGSRWIRPFFCRRLEVAHHAVGALDLELEADLADGRAVAASLDLAADEAVNLALPRRQCFEVGHGKAPESEKRGSDLVIGCGSAALEPSRRRPPPTTRTITN